MDEILPKITLIFLTISVILGIFHRLSIPGIIGLVMAGVVIGPHGLKLLEDRTQISLLADFGIILLMFSIGLDFNRDRLLELRRAAGIGFLQIIFCILVVWPLYYLLAGGSWQTAFMMGLLVSHTSSTLMLKIYSDRGEVATAPSRLGLGVSITQDLASVPMIIAVPFLAYGGGLETLTFSPKLFSSAALLVGAAVFARWVIPPLLGFVVQSRSRELILMFLILVCLGTSWATHEAGLSAALGAFIIGLALAGTHYSHQIHAEVSPLRDLLLALFFISVGMLLNVGSLFTHAHVFLPHLLAVIAIKFLSGFLPVLAWGYPLRIATLTGVAIAQIGEFALVLALVAQTAGVLDDTTYQVFVMTAVLSMLLSPFLIGMSERFFKVLHRLPFPPSMKQGRLAVKDATDDLADLKDHVLIAGFGLNGHNLARSLRSLSIRYAAIELEPSTVLAAQDRGECVYYGDCTRPDVLRRLRVEDARVFVVAISDIQATRRAVQVARSLSATLHIIVRTRHVYEIEHLLQVGANEVIPEEFETSLEILARTLHEYQIPRKTIDQAVLGFRSDAYQALREEGPVKDGHLILKDFSLALEIETVKIKAGDAALGKTLKDLALPSRTGVVILAIRQNDEVQTTPPADYVIRENDMLIMVGTHAQLIAALDLISGETPA